MLWNGLGVVPEAETLEFFSCPPDPPKFINPSLSSEVFLLPQILNATTPNPAKMIAPPIPTTTPMMVLRVLLLMPELEEDEPSVLRSAVPVGRVDVTVDEARELNVDPDCVKTWVLTTTKVVGVGVTLAVVFVVFVFELVDSASSSLDVLLVSSADADVSVAVGAEVVATVAALVDPVTVSWVVLVVVGGAALVVAGAAEDVVAGSVVDVVSSTSAEDVDEVVSTGAAVVEVA